MKLTNEEVEKAKKWLITTLILGVSVCVISFLKDFYIGMILGLFFIGMTATIFVMLIRNQRK